MSKRKSHSYATASGYLTAPNRNVLTAPIWAVADNSDEWEIKKPEFIDPTPDWVERIDGYSEETFDITSGPQYDNERIVAVCYKPERTLGVGFMKVFFADKDLKNMFPQMKGIWKETYRRDSETTLYPPKISKCKIDGNGRISSAFGIPDLQSLLDVVREMYTVWLDWYEFPNVGEFSMVKKLKQAKRDVATMQREMSSNRINGKIEDIRQEIKESQERIANLEKELNDICEKAADAMNLLEENGVKIDLDEKNGEETAHAIIDEGYDYPGIINHAYPGQGIFVGPPTNGTLLSTLPPEAFQLSKEELEIFQKGWENDSSYLTVDNSDSSLSKICACS